MECGLSLRVQSRLAICEQAGIRIFFEKLGLGINSAHDNLLFIINALHLSMRCCGLQGRDRLRRGRSNIFNPSAQAFKTGIHKATFGLNAFERYSLKEMRQRK